MAESPDNPVRAFLIDRIDAHPRDIASVAAETFGITRQAVHRHLSKLVKDGVVVASGTTRNREYTLAEEVAGYVFPLSETPDEDKVWRSYIEAGLTDLPDNVLRICHYGFTEIFNNAIDHSEGTEVNFGFSRSAKTVALHITDNGVGIFEKLKQRFGLEDRRHAILELSKGKLTTDPTRHSGQGIFFTSRMFDSFNIVSGGLVFDHERHGDDWLIGDVAAAEGPGTAVVMKIAANSTVTPKDVFDRFTDLGSDDYDFSKTHVPLRLAKYGRQNLVSRSQAKRVLAGFERFKEVILDFADVDSIGQAFADEIFRVFAGQHPETDLLPVRANEDVTRMIRRAASALKAEGQGPSAPA